MMGYQRLHQVLILLAHTMKQIYHIFTVPTNHIPSVIYISTCLCLQLLMYIFNINTKTRYSNIWLRPITYRKLQKYLKQWRIMLAHLNKRMDLYFQKHYKVVAYNIKTLPIRGNPYTMETTQPQEREAGTAGQKGMYANP